MTANLVGIVSKTTKAFLEVNTISIDNWTFKLYYKVTVTTAVVCSVLVSCKQFFGGPIVCDPGSVSGIKDSVLESYCWMYAHFKIPPEYKGPCSGTEQEDLEGPIYNSYYQWVPIYLIALSVYFYLPRCIWLMMEGGLMKFFGRGTVSRFIEEPEVKRDKLVKFFSANIHNKFNIYYFGFIFCEFLNLVVALSTLMFTDRFLHHRFLYYGIKVYIYYSLPPEEQRMSLITNPMCYTFPRVAACDYHRFGSGGRPENVNALCILGLNVINDKVFLVLWWWFMLLIIAGIGRLCFRLVQMNSAKLRFQMLNLRMHRYFKRNAHMTTIQNYVTKCSRGDWFVLYQLSKNINRPFFMDFLVTLSKQLDPEERIDAENGDTGDGVIDLFMSSKPRGNDSADEGSHRSRRRDKGDDDDAGGADRPGADGDDDD